MKALYASIFAVILLFPLAFAQDRPLPSHCSQDEPCLPEELNLSAPQKQQLEKIYERSRQERDALRQKTRDEVLQLLTPEQTEILKRYGSELLERQAARLKQQADVMEKRADEMKAEERRQAP